MIETEFRNGYIWKGETWNENIRGVRRILKV